MMSVEKRFQFHKGSIKTWDGRRNLGHKEVFQFHKGSIKTREGTKRPWIRSVSIPQRFD